MTADWTPQQRLAIETKDRNVLVTASAGTGKTTVLSKRCVDILSDQKDLTDVSRILVLTFTEASAEEMKSRIAVELSRVAARTGSSYLRRQQLLLDGAHISTIDAFCKRMITENFHVLGIDPTFGIIDPDEQKLIKSEILEEIIEQAWSEESLGQGLFEILSQRSLQNVTSGFLSNIFAVSGFLGSVESTGEWFDRADQFAAMDNLCGSPPAAHQKQIILEKLNECKSMLDFALMLDEKFTENCHWSGYIIQEYVSLVESCVDSLRKGTNDFIDLLTEFAPARFKVMPKGFDKTTAEMIKVPVNAAKDVIKSLAEFALVNPDYEELVLPQVSFQTKILLELVRRFDQKYKETKEKLNCLDFADLEHLMLRLLHDSPGTADQLRDQFKYIFIDEYQDTNFLQQAILERICHDNNLFVVGDIKQSIYAFRQAKPEIFIDLLKGATDNAGNIGIPLRVDLSDNFRSRRQVLDFANLIFSRIMTEAAAAVDYDQKAFLKAGFKYKESADDCFVEINLVDENQVGQSEGTTASQRQAGLIAERINLMIDNSTKIYDKLIDGYRNAAYGDIVILMRSPSTSVNDYLEILRLAGIPAVSQASSGYFQAAEICDMISLLKLLDNLHRDIELAAVMRSPLFNFTDTDLVLIRAFADDPKAAFYDCLLQYTKNGSDAEIRRKLTEMLDVLSHWRTMACRGSLADLIWHVYRRTGYLSLVTGLPDGKQRRANLLKLHDRAIRFEGFATNVRTASLTRFVEFIEKLDSENRDWAPAQPDTSADNAVRIMSVHNSKGLEFPIVFLAELNRQFNTRDIYSDCLYDNENTIGLKIINPDTKEKTASIIHQVIAAEQKKVLLAEEMRILYVAVTRARERLILTASVKGKKPAAIIRDCAVMEDAPQTSGRPDQADECEFDLGQNDSYDLLTHNLNHNRLKAWQLKSARSHLDWILYALGNQNKLQDVFQIESESSLNSDLFNVNIKAAETLNQWISDLRKKQKTLTDLPSCDIKVGKQLLEKVKSSLDWEYPFIQAARTDAKMSVSELTHRDDEFSKFDAGADFQRLPKFLQHEKTASKVDPKQTGTAVHLVIESLDLSVDITADTVKSVTENLCRGGQLSPEIAVSVDIDSIVDFFNSNIGSLAVDPSNTVMREWPFIYGLPAGRADDKSDSELIVIQGIVDMIIETPDGLVIVDFKTDNVTADTVRDRADKYRQQIDLYSTAASEILKRNVISSWLYFLKPSIAVEC